MHAIVDGNFAPVAPSGELYEVVFAIGLFAPLFDCENIESYTKPEAHSSSILHCCQKRTKPRVTCTEYLAKFRHVFLKYESGQTDKHTYRHADCNTSPTYSDFCILYLFAVVVWLGIGRAFVLCKTATFIPKGFLLGRLGPLLSNS